MRVTGTNIASSSTIASINSGTKTVTLNNNIERLKEDHLKAFEIEKLLSEKHYIKKVEEVETNILIFQLKSNYDSNIFLDKMLKSGVKLISMGDNKLRIVTHKDYNNEMHQKFIEIITNLQI